MICTRKGKSFARLLIQRKPKQLNSLLKDITYNNLWLDIGQRTLTKCTFEMKQNEKLLAGNDENDVIRLDDVDNSIRTIQTVMSWLTEVEQEPVSHVGDTSNAQQSYTSWWHAYETLARCCRMWKLHEKCSFEKISQDTIFIKEQLIFVASYGYFKLMFSCILFD